MGHHIIEFDEQCKECKATGLYVGMAEGKGVGIVCHRCKGTGCHHVKIEYDNFENRIERHEVRRVFEGNVGIVIGENAQYSLSDFGGMSYKEWIQGFPFPDRSEMRNFVCPAWWYQSVDYNKKPNWQSCVLGGCFSSCKCFSEKDLCWERWDKEN